MVSKFNKTAHLQQQATESNTNSYLCQDRSESLTKHLYTANLTLLVNTAVTQLKQTSVRFFFFLTPEK